MNPQRNSRRLIVIWLATAALALPATAAWAWGETVKGNGIIKQETRALGRFTGVALGLPAQVEIRMGNVESVSIETDENILPWVETSVE
jgi:hypothetical protein